MLRSFAGRMVVMLTLALTSLSASACRDRNGAPKDSRSDDAMGVEQGTTSPTLAVPTNAATDLSAVVAEGTEDVSTISSASDPLSSADSSDPILAPAPPLATVMALMAEARQDPRSIHQTTETRFEMTMPIGDQSPISVIGTGEADHWYKGADLARVEYKPFRQGVESSIPFAKSFLEGAVSSLGSGFEIALSIRNGDTVWATLPGLKRFTRTEALEYADYRSTYERAPELTAMAQEALEDQFDLVAVGTTEVLGARAYLVHATPKSAVKVADGAWLVAVDRLDFWVDADSGRIVQVRMAQTPTEALKDKPMRHNGSGDVMVLKTTYTMTVTATDFPTDLPDDWFTYTPPPGAEEVPFYARLRGLAEAVQDTREAIPAIASLDEARAFLSHPVLAPDPVPDGCAQDRLRVHELESGKAKPDAFLELRYDCSNLENGKVTIRQSPAGIEVALLVELREELLKLAGSAGESRQVQIGGHTATMTEHAHYSVLVWDAGATHIDMSANRMSPEQLIEFARALR